MKPADPHEIPYHDVAIVGGGPIGLEAAVALGRAGVDYIQFEAGQIGETILRWPPRTRFFSSPERIAIAGTPIPTVDQAKPTGEEYLAYLRSLVIQWGLKVQTYEPVIQIERQADNFLLLTEKRGMKRKYRAGRVILACGGMSGPRRLGIPGEDLPHVSHYVADPHRYFLNRVLVVGGRNSALEAALRLFRAGAEVTLSYRRGEIDAELPKAFLYNEVQMWIKEGKIHFLPGTAPVEITPRHVVLANVENDGTIADDDRFHFDADFVLLCTGFTADMRLFRQLGVELRHEGLIPCFRDDTMETNVRGVYVAGTATAGTQDRFTAFIETSHVHVEKIVKAISGKRTVRAEGLSTVSETA